MGWIQKVRDFTQYTDVGGGKCNELTYSIRCKTKAAGIWMEIWEPGVGAVMSWDRVKSSRRDFENKANGIPASFAVSLGEVCAVRNGEKARESSLAEKQSGRQRKMRLTASGEDCYTVRSGLHLRVSLSERRGGGIYRDAFTYINMKTQTVNSLQPFSLKQTCKLNQIVHLYKLIKCS